MDKLLKQIQSADGEEIYEKLTDRASIWAICGFVDCANSLLQKLWSLNLPHSRNTWLMDEGFQFIWHLTNSTPTHFPFPAKELEAMQAHNWQNHFMPYWNSNAVFAQRIAGKDWTELSDNDLNLVAIGMAYDENSPSKESSKQQQLLALQALTKYIKTYGPIGHSLMNSLICVAILAARNGLEEQAKEHLIHWAQAYKKYYSNTFAAYIMRDLSTAKLLVTGILASTFDLSEEKCQNNLQEISEALNQRILKGQSLAYGNLKFKALLKQVSTKAIQSNEIENSETKTSKNWLGFKPAIKSEIAEAETRLNIKLPKEYCDFLLASNGFQSFGFCPSLHRVQDIGWLKILEPELYETYTQEVLDLTPDFVNKFSSSLLIGGHKEEQKLLLIPSSKSKNWECWLFAYWIPGERSYPNFRYYIERQLDELDKE